MFRYKLLILAGLLTLIIGNLYSENKVIQKIESSGSTTLTVPYNKLITISFGDKKIISKVNYNFKSEEATMSRDDFTIYITVLKPVNIIIRMKTGEMYYLNLIPKEGISDVNFLLADYNTPVKDDSGLSFQGIMDQKSTEGMYNNVSYRILIFYMVNFPTINPLDYSVQSYNESPKEYKLFKNYSIKILKLKCFTGFLRSGYVYVIINDRNENLTLEYPFILPYFYKEMDELGFTEIEALSLLSKELPGKSYTYAYVVMTGARSSDNIDVILQEGKK
ncbi:MAG: hypothetical protein HPY53_01325 [Brevinematales bacterium]|nr:hypothetical protein [Brevinematales bacterium]